MTDRLQLQFFTRVYVIAGIVVGVVAVGLVVGGLVNFALGLVGGALIGLLMIHGTVLLGSALVSRAQPREKSARSMKGVVAAQIAKYVVGIGTLYVLVVIAGINAAGIALGYGIPLAVLVVMSLAAAKQSDGSGDSKI